MKNIIFNIKLFLASLVISLSFIGVSVVPQSYAFDLFPQEVCNAKTADSAVCKDSNSSGNPVFGPGGIISSAIILLSFALGIAAVIVIMYAGMKYITSGSNPQEVTKARELILYAVVGIIIAAFAQVLVRFIINNI